jgi:hypothetical protein
MLHILLQYTREKKKLTLLAPAVTVTSDASFCMIQFDVQQTISGLIPVQLFTTMMSAQLVKSKLIYNSTEQFYTPLVNSSPNSSPLTYTKTTKRRRLNKNTFPMKEPCSHWGGRDSVGVGREGGDFEKILV